MKRHQLTIENVASVTRSYNNNKQELNKQKSNDMNITQGNVQTNIGEIAPNDVLFVLNDVNGKTQFKYGEDDHSDHSEDNSITSNENGNDNDFGDDQDEDDIEQMFDKDNIVLTTKTANHKTRITSSRTIKPKSLDAGLITGQPQSAITNSRNPF